ncbi:MAG: YtxH domain-containing protein [Armatimonadia bacterium]
MGKYDWFLVGVIAGTVIGLLMAWMAAGLRP